MTTEWPPITDPEVWVRVRTEANKRLKAIYELARETYEKSVIGFHDTPPRQRLAFYLAQEQAWAPIGGVLAYLKAIERNDPEEALWQAKDYAKLRTGALRRNGTGVT